MDYDDYLAMQEERRFHDCDCNVDCDLCDDEECDCGAHQEDCGTCQTQRGCRCDSLYDSWRDEQVRVVS
jgi:hypothetical protein